MKIKILLSLITFFVCIQANPDGTDDKKQTDKVEEIFCVDNVVLFSIAADKSIMPKTECSKRLKVLRLKDGKLLLHIEKCLSYPLVPNDTPVVHSDDGTITLPDLETKGAAIGFKLPAGLDNVLLQAIQDEVHKTYGEKAARVITGADAIADGLVKKAEELKVYIDKQTAHFRTGAPVQAGSYRDWTSHTKQAKTISTTVLSTTNWAVNIMDNAYKKVGAMAAPHFQAGTSRIISTLIGKDRKENDKEPNELTIASIKAYNKINNTIGKSTTIITETVRQSSVQVFQHNFGEDMGGAFDNALDAAKNTVTVIGQIRSFTPLGIIRNAAGHIVGYDPDGDGQSQNVCNDY